MRIRFYVTFTPIDQEPSYFYGRIFPASRKIKERMEWDSADVPNYVREKVSSFVKDRRTLDTDGEAVALGLGIYITKYNYLDENHPEAFKDIEVKPDRGYISNPIPCPRCKGHGKWNLVINSYGVGKHFQASCGQCNGWGFVDGTTSDATCVHEWGELSSKEARARGIDHFGMCYHVYACTKPGCTAVTARDSSD